MSRTLQAVLCFVFIGMCIAQDYGGRKKGMVGGMMGGMAGGLMALQGGGMHGLGGLNGILGSTVVGRPLRGGDMLPDGTMLPRHGGVRHPSGLINGWGSDGGVPFIGDDWVDPLNGMAWPEQYNGERLIMDPVSNSWRIAEHNAAKAGAAMGGAMVGGVMPGIGGSNVVHGVNKAGMSGIPAIGASPMAAQSGHGLAKAAIGQAAFTVDMMTGGGVMMGNPIANDVAAGQAMESLQVAKNTVHMSRKDNAMGGARMVGGMPLMSGVGAPIMAGRPVVDHIGHNIAKSTGTHIGLSGLGHSMVGGVGGVMPGMVGPAMVGGRTNIVHETRKAGMSGIPAIGHSPVAATGGHRVAKQAVGQAAHIVDKTTGGLVSMGDPMANHVAANLARETMHVGRDTVNQAATMTAMQNGGMPMGGAMLGGAVGGMPMGGAMMGGAVGGMPMGGAMMGGAVGGMPMGGAMIGGAVGGMPMGGAMMGGAVGGMPMVGQPMIGGGMIKPKKVVKPIKGYGGRRRF